MGVSQSGVRQVANAAGTCDEDRIARTAIVVRRTALVLGVAGAILLAVLAAPVSELTFARAGHAADVALLSLAVLLSVIAGGQTALLQGLRRIGDLARIGILGAVTGTLVSLPIVYSGVRQASFRHWWRCPASRRFSPGTACAGWN